MIIGVDVGGTNVDVVAYDEEFMHVATYPTLKVADKLADILKDLVKKFEAEAVGIGFAGWIRNGKILRAPNVRFKLKLDLDVPYRIENDANCFALFASRTFGFKNILGITVGTGVGSGIIFEGKIYRGLGLAGEIGHWFVDGEDICTCGGKGHLECYFGGWSFQNSGLHPEEIVKSGEIYKLKGFDIFCIAVANAIALLDPEAVIFGGRIGGNLNEEILKERIYGYLMPEFRPVIKTLKDPLAVAKGACLMMEVSP